MMISRPSSVWIFPRFSFHKPNLLISFILIYTLCSLVIPPWWVCSWRRSNNLRAGNCSSGSFDAVRLRVTHWKVIKSMCQWNLSEIVPPANPEVPKHRVHPTSNTDQQDRISFTQVMICSDVEQAGRLCSCRRVMLHHNKSFCFEANVTLRHN